MLNLDETPIPRAFAFFFVSCALVSLSLSVTGKKRRESSAPTGSNRRMGSPRRRARAADQQLTIVRAPAARLRCPAALPYVFVGILIGSLGLLALLLHAPHQP